MSDKHTAYRADSFYPSNEAEMQQNGQVIDPATGQPVQQWQTNPQGYTPQEGYIQQEGYAPQNGYSQQDQTQYATPDYSQAGYQNPQHGYQDQTAETYQQPYQQTTQLPDYSAQNQHQHGYEQPVDPAQQAYSQQGTYGYGEQQANNPYAQPSHEGHQQAYAPGSYVEEQDPYLAAHQNATPPFDAAQHGMNAQYDQNTAYAEGYHDPAAYNNMASVDAGQAPALYNGTTDQLANQQGQYGQQGYGHPDYQGAVDYNGAPYGAQVMQQPQGMAQLNDPYAPAPLQQPQMVDDGAFSGRKSFMVGAMILGSVIIGGGVAFAYKYSGDGASGDRAPLILSDGGDGKVVPENPGGREFENQNKKIFDRLGDAGAVAKAAVVQTKDPDVVQSLRGDVSDKPALREESASKDGVGGARLVRTYKINRNGERIADNNAFAGQDQKVKDITGVAVDIGKPSRTVKTSREGAAVRDKNQVEQRVASLEKQRDVQAASDGDFVVQISARRTQQDALAAFSGLQSKYGDVLTGYRPLIQRADLGAKGVFYRLRVGPMASKDSAVSVCSKLKAKGLKGCFPTKR